jgi:hypothetical protein
MGNRYLGNLIRTMRESYARIIAQEEGEDEMVSWRTLDPNLLNDIPANKLRRVKSAIKEQVRQEVLREMRHDPAEVEDDRIALKQFARDVEIDASAHAIVMVDETKKSDKRLAQFIWARVVGTLAILSIVVAGGFTTTNFFPGASFGVFMGMVVTSFLLGFLLMIGISESENKYRRDVANFAAAGHDYKELADLARETWRTEANRAHDTEHINELFNVLKRKKDSVRGSNGVKLRITDLEPVRERLRIHASADEDDFDARLSQAQKKDEEEEIEVETETIESSRPKGTKFR